MAKGMNVEVCRSQAEVLENQATKIKNIKTRIDGLMQELQNNWWGEDARKFSQKWEGTHKAELSKVHQKLKQVAEQVRTEARAQETKSRS